MLLKQVLRQRDGNEPLPTRFQEVVERDGGRLDVRHGLRDEPFKTVLAAAIQSRLAAALTALLGDDAEVVAAGNVVAMSMEGWVEHVDMEEGTVLADSMGPQAWHADGPHLFADAPDSPMLPVHALNVFVPLVDLTADKCVPQPLERSSQPCALSERVRPIRALRSGATEFAPGSHVRGCEFAEGCDRPTRTILARAGDAIVFDYRLWHRGLPNVSDRDRPLLYFVAARSFWRDDRNYRQGQSLFEGAPSASASAPSTTAPVAADRVPLMQLASAATVAVTGARRGDDGDVRRTRSKRRKQ